MGPLMTWRTQAWEHDKHVECRSSHRFFCTKLLACDAVILRKKMTLLEGVSPTSPVGHIWVSTCTRQGTSVNISCLNKVFNYQAPVLGNFYEIVTVNDINAFYVAVIIYTPSTTDAIIAKFWVILMREVDGGFNHYVDPSDVTHLTKMRVHPKVKRTNQGEVYIYDGGMEAAHVSGSFEERDVGAIRCLQHITNDGNEFVRIGTGRF